MATCQPSSRRSDRHTNAALAAECHSCGYDSAGLPAEARCPECGSSPGATREPRRIPLAVRVVLVPLWMWPLWFPLLGSSHDLCRMFVPEMRSSWWWDVYEAISPRGPVHTSGFYCPAEVLTTIWLSTLVPVWLMWYAVERWWRDSPYPMVNACLRTFGAACLQCVVAVAVASIIDAFT